MLGSLTTVGCIGNICDRRLFMYRCTHRIFPFKEFSKNGRNGGPFALGSFRMVKIWGRNKNENSELTHHTHFSPIHGNLENFISQSFHLRKKLER